jgi:hypothetical protein
MLLSQKTLDATVNGEIDRVNRRWKRPAVVEEGLAADIARRRRGDRCEAGGGMRDRSVHRGLSRHSPRTFVTGSGEGVGGGVGGGLGLGSASEDSPAHGHLQVAGAEVVSSRGGGGNFYYTKPVQVSKRFAGEVIGSALAGWTTYTEAMRLLGIKKMSTFEGLAEQLGVR